MVGLLLAFRARVRVVHVRTMEEVGVHGAGLQRSDGHAIVLLLKVQCLCQVQHKRLAGGVHRLAGRGHLARDASREQDFAALCATMSAAMCLASAWWSAVQLHNVELLVRRRFRGKQPTLTNARVDAGHGQRASLSPYGVPNAVHLIVATSVSLDGIYVDAQRT